MIIRAVTMPKLVLARMVSKDPDLLSKCFVISICEVADRKRPLPIEHPRLLNLSFDDLGPEEIPEEMRSRFKYMSQAEARATVEFIERCHALDDRGTLIVQCTA